MKYKIITIFGIFAPSLVYGQTTTVYILPEAVNQGMQPETFATVLFTAGMSSLLFLVVATVKRFRTRPKSR